MLLILLVACNLAGTGVSVKPEPDDTATDTDDGLDTDPADTDDTDGDLDDDGYTPDEGDCDDDDVRVSPGRPEDDNDGKDNDCDGRVDEEFAGLDVAYVAAEGSSEILTIDTIGRVDDSVTVSDGCYPMWIDRRADGGWFVNDAQGSAAIVDADGTCTRIGDFSETDYGLWGVAVGPDGTAYGVTIDSLVSVSDDGTVTELARWEVDFETPNVELLGSAVAVDWATGEVGIFDYYGGFATWTATGGLVVHIAPDIAAPTHNMLSGAHRDGGDWYAPAVSATGYGIWRFDAASNAWVEEERWADEDWTPFMLAIDGESGDYYVTANAGWYYTVWRVVEGSGYAADLYVTDGTEPNRAFNGIVARYD